MFKPFVSLVMAVGLGTPVMPAAGQPEAPHPVNAVCPVGQEPVVAAAGTAGHRGHNVGFCCPGCRKPFLAWDEARKDAFVVSVAVAPAEAPPTTGEAVPMPTYYPYTLSGCPVGGPLSSMGEPVVKVYSNSEVRFCCAGCIGEFEAHQDKYRAEIDIKTAEQQLVHYPLDTCIVTGEALGDQAVNHVYYNRLVRLAHPQALALFQSDPATYLADLDGKIIESQLPGYPLDHCPVGGPLGSMGEPVNFIYMNRLVRFCCAGCEQVLVNEPARYMTELDVAYPERRGEAQSAAGRLRFRDV